MNSWPSVLPAEPDLTWYLSDMCNYYYELLELEQQRHPCTGTCTNGTPTHPLNPLSNPTGDQSEGQAAYGNAGFNECAQGVSTLAANSSKKINVTVTLK